MLGVVFICMLGNDPLQDKRTNHSEDGVVRRTSGETRKHILDVASNHFYWKGIHATGVDVVAEAASVAPTSLYRAFSSKDGLVTAYIDHEDLKFRAHFEASVMIDPDPRERILSVFRAMSRELHPSVCRGCSAQMALAEYPDANSKPHQRAKEIKDWLFGRYRDLATSFCAARAQHADPALLASQLFIVHEGMMAGALSGRSDRLAYPGAALVETLLDAMERSPSEFGE
jgi:AcrR family transcriptional regulator